MVNKYLRAIVLTICISALFTVLTSCEKVKDSTANNMNDTELLSTIDEESEEIPCTISQIN